MYLRQILKFSQEILNKASLVFVMEALYDWPRVSQSCLKNSSIYLLNTCAQPRWKITKRYAFTVLCKANHKPNSAWSWEQCNVCVVLNIYERQLHNIHACHKHDMYFKTGDSAYMQSSKNKKLYVCLQGVCVTIRMERWFEINTIAEWIFISCMNTQDVCLNAINELPNYQVFCWLPNEESILSNLVSCKTSYQKVIFI